jgi:DNA gyrase subunit A
MTTIIDKTVDELYNENYKVYGSEILMERAIPSIEDGLLPVHRKLLWTFHELNYGKQFRKAANILGSCMAFYYVHGNLSLYSTLMSLSQPWLRQAVLVEGQGNIGDIKGNSSAAERYVEVRISNFSTDVYLQDIDKNTIDLVNNYDKTKKEPITFSTKIPMILIMGNAGIGCGFVSDIPSHNIGEIIDGTLACLQKDNLSVKDILTYIKGPDSPTGSIIINGSDCEEIYTKGQGIFKLQSRIIKDTFKGKDVLRVTEIPYRSSTNSIVEDLVSQCKINPKTKKPGILNDKIYDIHDMSDNKAVNIIIIPKKGVSIDYLKTFLLENTSLSTSQKYICNTLYNGKFYNNLPLNQLIYLWIEFRISSIKRKYNFLIKDKQHKLILLRALLKAQDNIDDVIAIIKKSSDKQNAKKLLMDKFSFVDVEAEYIVNISLYKISNIEVKKLKEEIESISTLIEEYIEVLSDDNNIKAIIKDELLSIKKKYDIKRKTEIVNLISNNTVESEIIHEDITLYIKNDFTVVSNTNLDDSTVYNINTSESMYVFLANGKYLIVEGYKLKREASFNELIDLNNSRVIGIVFFRDNVKSLLVVTDNCKVKHLNASEFTDSSKPRSNGTLYITLDDNKVVGVYSVENESVPIKLKTNKNRNIKITPNNVKISLKPSKGTNILSDGQIKPKEKII